MRTSLLSFLLLLFAVSTVPAQQQRFDPVVFLSTLRIRQFYGQGNERIPPGMHATNVDSVVSNDRCVGFSLLLEADSGDGWSMWLDYDGDQYFRPRLMRVFAQRRVGEDEETPLEQLKSWVESVQKKSVGPARETDEGVVEWAWLQQTSYVLRIRRVTQDKADWLTLMLEPDTSGD